MYRKLSDKAIDLIMLGVNVVVLGIPFLIATIFFKIDLEEYFFKDYILSSTLNKFAIIVTINSLFILFEQHNLPQKRYGKIKIKNFIRYSFLIISFISGSLLVLTDLVLLIISFLSVETAEINTNIIIITTITNTTISLIINFFLSIIHYLEFF